MSYPRILLQSGREQALTFRHPWIFSRAIAKVPQGLEGGSLVAVCANNGTVLATGYYNSHSQIALRLFAFGSEQALDQRFFEEKLKECLAQRQKFIDFKTTNAYRLVFAEGDFLPGLIVDHYGDFLVIQVHTLGMEKLKSVVVAALQKVFQPAGIYERSDLEVRKKEGLKTLPTGVLFGETPPDSYEILENGIRYFVDMKHGQKTGFFLDQRQNRQAVKAYSKGKTVLNLFSYSGGFSVAALQGGAKKVTSVDISQDALNLARRNFSLNSFDPDQHEFIETDVFDYLKKAQAAKRKFDVIVVDPPAFVKNKESLNHGVNAYIQLNAAALKLLTVDGIFVTSSCSSHVSVEMFRTILFKAALQAGVSLALVDSKIQPPDHPINVSFPEGEYLKFFVTQART